MEWGEAIEVNGVRPDWLRDDEVVYWSHAKSSAQINASGLAWSGQPGFDNAVEDIRLPADHPYYTVQNHNARHGTNFAYWPGGDSPPDDWDGGPVLNRGGGIFKYAAGMNWRDCHCGGVPDYGDIIGYTRKAVEKPVEDHVSVKRITESEAEKLIRDHDYDIVKVLDSLGIIRPCTREERFTQETGITVTPDVRAALEWKE